jgi:hypothetical protein
MSHQRQLFSRDNFFLKINFIKEKKETKGMRDAFLAFLLPLITTDHSGNL